MYLGLNLHYLLLCSVLFLGTGCAPIEGQQTKSILSHDLSQSGGRVGRKLNCIQHVPQNNAEKKIYAYLDGLKEYIIHHNHKLIPEEFIEQICIKVLGPRREVPYYSLSEPLTGNVYINAKTLLRSTNDAMVAAILTHEFAHIIQQHDQVLTRNLEHFLRDRMIDQEFSNLKLQMKLKSQTEKLLMLDLGKFYATKTSAINLQNLYRQQQQEITANQWEDLLKSQSLCSYLNEQTKGNLLVLSDGSRVYKTDFCTDISYERFVAKTKRLVAGIQAAREMFQALLSDKVGAEMVANYLEEEADEIGFEYYLNAGFYPQDFLTFLYDINHPGIGFKITDFCPFMLANPFISEKSSKKLRGTEPHPGPCWRIANIIYREFVEHRDLYHHLFEKAQITFVKSLPITNSRVRQTIRDLYKPVYDDLYLN